jgi:polyisoprenoid-binding protein YceI
MIEPGKYVLGPDRGTLKLRTGKTGAAAKAGHDLVIEVGSWEATLEIGETPEQSLATLTVDSHSLRVVEGLGGMPFGDKETASAEKSIDQEVLKGTAIGFHSSELRVSPDGTGISVQGELELAGQRRPVAFELAVDGDGRLTGATRIKQTDWGIKQYSTLFGALKVADEVGVEIDAKL